MLKLYANQLKMNEKTIKNKSQNELRCIWILNNNKLKQVAKLFDEWITELFRSTSLCEISQSFDIMNLKFSL